MKNYTKIVLKLSIITFFGQILAFIFEFDSVQKSFKYGNIFYNISLIISYVPLFLILCIFIYFGFIGKKTKSIK